MAMQKIRLVFFLSISFLILGSPLLYAEGKYAIREMTPEVKDALENRKNRFEELRQFKSQGVIGESNHGYLELFLDNMRAKALVYAENKDRETIYKAIQQQNNLVDALGTIEKVFAQVQRDKASLGDKIQGEDGNWTVK